MFSIQNITYSKALLKEICIEKCSGIYMEEWELNFWMFLKNWFDENKNYIEVKTSGSTGKPKLIRHQKKYMIASAENTCNFFALNDSKTALLCLPITSIGGIMMIVRALVSGMHLEIEKPSSNPLKNLNLAINFVAMVPFQVQKSLDENPEKWNFISEVIIGAGQVSNSLKDLIIQNKISAYSTFGMTETISHIALNKIGETENYKALQGISFSVNEENCLKISAPDLGIENILTNDIVDLKNPQEFIWKGRKDNAIETGGIKVIPELIEKKIHHFFTERFFISSLKDKLLSNKIVLLIESVESDFEINSLHNVLDKYEIPKEIFYVEKFIETNTGKISRIETMKLLEL